MSKSICSNYAYWNLIKNKMIYLEQQSCEVSSKLFIAHWSNGTTYCFYKKNLIVKFLCLWNDKSINLNILRELLFINYQIKCLVLRKPISTWWRYVQSATDVQNMRNWPVFIKCYGKSIIMLLVTSSKEH